MARGNSFIQQILVDVSFTNNWQIFRLLALLFFKLQQISFFATIQSGCHIVTSAVSLGFFFFDMVIKTLKKEKFLFSLSNSIIAKKAILKKGSS